ncbi:MAG TPA: hypothetical protein VE170_05375 [Candidatus Limnocylindria bacterium]|nr:hypothetical protein [Candidatus Limnocylindria bacterium]
MKILLALSLVVLGGCVQARDPQLLAMRQVGDGALTCEQIAVEFKSNTEVALNKITTNRANDRRELVLGILVWPGLFELKNPDGNEANALLDRNIYLREAAKGKSCPAMETWPGQPERYTMNSYWSTL